MLESFLECDIVDTTIQDEDHNTLLHHAVFHGRERCVWLLLDKYWCNPRQTLQREKRDCVTDGLYINHYARPSKESGLALLATLLQKSPKIDVVETSERFQQMVQKVRK